MVALPERLAKCPSPVRPRAALNYVQFNNSTTVDVQLQIHFCWTTKKDRDIFFHLTGVFINNSKIISVPPFDLYGNYHIFLPNCTARLLYSPSMRFTRTFNEKVFAFGSKPYISYACDYLMTNCKPLAWRCSNLDRKKYEHFLPILFSQTLTPDERWNETATAFALIPSSFENKGPGITRSLPVVEENSPDISFIFYVLGFVAFMAIGWLLIHFGVW